MDTAFVLAFRLLGLLALMMFYSSSQIIVSFAHQQHAWTKYCYIVLRGIVAAPWINIVSFLDVGVCVQRTSCFL